MISAPPQLEYAIRQGKTGRTFRRLIGLVVIASIGFTSWKFGPAAFTQVNYLYVQRQLMNHELPADTVVFSLDPIEAKRLLDRGYFHVDVAAPHRWTHAPIAVGNRSSTFAKAGPHLNQTLVGSGVFMHRRRTRDTDEERLVQIQCFFVQSISGSYETALLVYAGTPAGLSIGSRYQLDFYTTATNVFPQEPIRIFAGQVDESDATRFIIPFDTNAGHFNLHGQLLHDSSITWEIKG